MTNKKTMSFIALGIVTLLGIGLVAAYQGNPAVQGPNYSEDRHAAMQDAFETGNYDAWVTLMTQDGRHPRIVDVITVENFAEFVAAHQSGDVAALAELRAELGLGQGKMARGSGEGMKGSGQGMRGQGYSGNCPYAE